MPSSAVFQKTYLDLWAGIRGVSVPLSRGATELGICRGIVTADVLELGLSRGAIATRKLEGVMRDKEHEGLYWFGPLR